MKDEIKEILDNLKNIEDYLSFSEASKLLDYITNLQEENERLKQINEKAIEILKLCNSKCAKETINILKGDIK